MWDRSYRWQRAARIGAGAVVLLALAAGAITFAQTDSAARAAAGMAEVARESNPDAASTVTCIVPAELNTRRGGLVYREGEGGTAEIVGRVLAVRHLGDEDEITILLTPAAAGAMSGGGPHLGRAADTVGRARFPADHQPGDPARRSVPDPRRHLAGD
jgi:hypothetical protein